jgi:uncharacterized protein YjbI with pentapeptide repeats
MKKCKVCTDTNECILHIEKSSYQEDWRKSNFLDKFYDELIQYIIDYIGQKKIEESFSIYWRKNNSSEMYCDISKENIMSYFKPYFDNENYAFDFLFKDKVIIFDHIYFPDYDDRDSFNYSKILLKLKKIHFNYCKFHTSHLALNDKEVFFQDCEFFDMYIISNSDILKNQSNIIYQMCTFNDDVSISKMDIEDSTINYTLFRDCKFNKRVIAHNMTFKQGVFNNSKHNKFTNLYNLELYNCLINDDFILQAYTISIFDVSETTFNGKVKIQFCKLLSNATFYNTKFNNLADFYQTTFNKVEFERTDFNEIAVFSEAIFNNNIHFKYTKFLKKSIFRDMIIKRKLDLRNTIFDDEANFLDIRSEKEIHTPIQVENRETARVIKNFYETSNNVIEANKFYTLEMKEREKELNKDMQKAHNLFEWITFKFHAISSNHSQDWVIASFWIICITLLYSHFNFVLQKEKTEYYILPFVLNLCIFILLFLEINIYQYIKNIYKIIAILCLYLIYGFSTNDYNLSIFSNNINPFSIMTGDEHLNFVTLIYKIIIAYLIYQTIVSMRQNTRRK